MPAPTNQLVRGLQQDAHGIWHTPDVAKMSYPDNGNERCFRVEDNSFWFRHRNACIAALVSRYPPPGYLLDVGAGNGVVSEHLRRQGVDTVALEPGPVGARNAKLERGLPHVVRARFEDLAPGPGSVPAIGTFDVLEHIEKDRAFVAQLCDALQPGGRLYLTVPAHPWLWSGNDVRSGHFRRYSRDTLLELLGAALETEWLSALFGPLALPVLLFRSLPLRLHLVAGNGPVARPSAHGTHGGLLTRLLCMLLKREQAALCSGRPPRLGTSFILVARRRAPHQIGTSGRMEQ